MKFKHKKSDRYLVTFQSQNGVVEYREILSDSGMKNLKDLNEVAKCIIDSNPEVSGSVAILSIVKFPIK